MSTAAIIAIAIAVVVVLGGASLRHARPPLATCAAPARCPRETRRRDPAAPRPSRRPRRVRRADAATRSSAPGAIARDGTRASSRSSEHAARPVVSSRPGGDRRQPPAVLQPGDRHADERRRSARSSPPASSPSCGRRPTGGFGGKVTVGKLDEILETIRTGDGFFYAAEARTWITEYPADALPKAEAVYYPRAILAGMEQGIVALYQKCPHLGCRVPDCPRAQWFECPCHGSQYNRVGEKKAGPAPRGMDRFPVAVGGNGDVTVDTGTHRHRPADRHQHHRPGGRGPALHHRRRRALMHARGSPRRPPRRIAWILLGVIVVGWLVYALAQLRGGAQGGRLGDRARRQPQAVLRRRGRSRASASSACSSRRDAARHPRHRRCRCTGCSSPSGRPAPRRAGRALRHVGLGAVRADRRRRLQLRRLPRRDERHGGQAAVHGHRSGHRRGAGGRLEGAGAQHGALSLRRGRGALHHHLRPAVLADVGLGSRGRRPDERPADRHADRLSRSRSRSPARTACEEEGDPLCESGHLPTEDQADIETAARQPSRTAPTPATARRCSTSTSPAAPTAAPGATRRAGATVSPACPGRALRVEPHRWRDDANSRTGRT